MKKLLTTAYFLLFTGVLFAQNTIEVSQDKHTSLYYNRLDKNLEEFQVPDLRTAPYNAIRVWYPGKVVTYVNDSTLVSLFVDNETLKKEHPFDVSYAGIPENTITIASLKEVVILDKAVIGCKATVIEIVENGNYYTKALKCDANSSKIIQSLRTNFTPDAQLAFDNFLKTLQPGQYRINNLSQILDHPITNEADKSDLYKLIEKKLAEKGVTIPTTVLGQHPIFYSMNPVKQYYYKELNEIPLAKVKDIQIIGSSVMLLLL